MTISHLQVFLGPSISIWKDVLRFFCPITIWEISLHAMINIGEHIQQQVKAQGKTSIWLARELGCHRTNVYNLFDKYSIDTQQLQRISIIMHYNFFDLYCEDTERKIRDNLPKA